MSIFMMGKLDFSLMPSHAQDMVSYIGIRRRHVDYLTVSCSACRMPR
jgi:hypothetical protein